MHLELKFNTNNDKVVLISQVLTLLDAKSICYTDNSNKPILEPKVNTTPFWDFVTIRVLFAINIDITKIKLLLKKEFAIDELDVKTIADENWEDSYKKHFKITNFNNKLMLIPLWEKNKSLNIPKGAKTVYLDPGLAFGSGTHQTTRLCLEYLAKYPPQDITVIDYGSGSGILAISASKLGAKKVIAIDYDPQALIASNNNANINNVDIIVLNSEKSTNYKCDLLIANILTNTIISLKARFLKLLKPKSKILLTGILREQKELVKNTYNNYFDFNYEETKDEWCLLVGERK